MKSSAHESLYFSAYPLKAITKKASSGNEESQSPYLKSILSGKSRSISRVRVFPMANPYAQKLIIKPRVKPAKNVEPPGKEWFNNYE